MDQTTDQGPGRRGLILGYRKKSFGSWNVTSLLEKEQELVEEVER